jgi:hypothetical protein
LSASLLSNKKDLCCLPGSFVGSVLWLSLLKIYPPENWPMVTTKLILVLRLKRLSKDQTEFCSKRKNMLAVQREDLEIVTKLSLMTLSYRSIC